MKQVVVAVSVAFVAATIQAIAIYIPADQPTIQAGIDVASAEDTVEVVPAPM